MHISNQSENMSNLVVTVELSECHKYLFIFFITGIKMLGYKKVVHYENNRKFIGYTSPECVYLFGCSLVSSNILWEIRFEQKLQQNMKAPCVRNYPVFSEDTLHTSVFNHIVAVVNFNECFFQKNFFKEAIRVYWIWKKQKSVKEKQEWVAYPFSRIFVTQESNWGLLHCRWILYQMSYQGSPKEKKVAYNISTERQSLLVFLSWRDKEAVVWGQTSMDFDPGSSISLSLQPLIFLICEIEIKIASILSEMLIIKPNNTY